MKHFLYILFFSALILSGFKGNAQRDKDRIEALRVSFISKRLALTTAESEKFWPIYNEYTDKLRAVKKNLKQSYRKITTEPTEAEAEELYQLELRSQQAELDLHKQYSEKIKAVIGVKKMVKLRQAEEDFRREIINTIKDRNE